MKEHVLKVREPPLVAQSNIPVTCIIPPTPINATSFVDSDDHASVETLLLGQSEPSTSSSGHRTAAINNILDEGLQQPGGYFNATNQQNSFLPAANNGQVALEQRTCHQWDQLLKPLYKIHCEA